MNMDRYEFSLVGNTLTRFVWDDFANWNIELSKTGLNSDDPSIVYSSKATLSLILKNILIMIHPFMPFVSEEIYLKMPEVMESINLENWPLEHPVNHDDLYEVDVLINTISAVRELKVSYDLKPSKTLSIGIHDGEDKTLNLNTTLVAMLERMAKVELTEVIGETLQHPIKGASLIFLKEELIDPEALMEKLTKEKATLKNEIKRASSMLANKNFVDKAPEAKVREEKDKLKEYERQLTLVTKQLEEI